MESIPEGLCQCGCGLKTNIAPKSHAASGNIKGKPYRFIKGHHRVKSPVDYIVEDTGYETPCWIWQRSVTWGGYGLTGSRRKGNRGLAHRVYYKEKYGAIEDGLQLDHLCDVPRCVNPDHVKPTTGADNVRRGKHVKLTVEKVQEIKALLREGKMTQAAIAPLYGVARETINDINTGRRWGDVA